MRISAPTQFAVAVGLLVAAFAGCVDPAAGPDESPTPTADPVPGQPPLAGAPPAATDPLALPWALPECRHQYLSLAQEEGAAREGLPGDYPVQGDLVATLGVQAFACEAVVVGNVTVQQPFGLALVYQLLRPDPDQPTAVHGYVRELFVTEAALAARLVAFGFPARVAQVGVGNDGTTLELAISADGIDYQATAPAPADMGDAAYTVATHFVTATADRQAYMDGTTTVRATSSFVPAVVQATGGYLGSSLPAGTFAGQLTPSSAGLALRFGERSL